MEREQQRPHQEEQKQHLYLILDDNRDGYSIRKISLSPPSSSLRQSRSSSPSSRSKKKRKTTKKNTAAASSSGVHVQCLPEPIVRLETRRGLPSHFAAVGTRILFTQCLNYSHDHRSLIMPVFDVRSRGVTVGPGNFADDDDHNRDIPIYITVGGGEVFALSFLAFSKLSFDDDPLRRPPPPALGPGHAVPWSWHQLPRPPSMAHVDLTSYAVDADGHTIVFSADFCPDYDDPDFADDDVAPATFAFDTRATVWERRGDWALPFAGRAFFVPCLGAFVGLSKDPATSGHLVSCEPADTGPPAAWKLGKEKMFSDDPAETHVSATLVYTGSGGRGEFCLVQCVSVKHGSNGNASDEKNSLDEEEPHRPGYRYRLTTFPLSYDSNGDLTTGQTCWVQCYDVPRETSQSFIDAGHPVAFWL